MAAVDTTRKWLREGGYDNVVAMIDGRLAEWKAQGKTTRRNWWDILAGDEQGRPRTVDGIAFPVLRAAQLRQRKPVSADALCNDPKEKVPAIRVTKRWPRRKRQRTRTRS
jgi:hypothetical protein